MKAEWSEIRGKQGEKEEDKEKKEEDKEKHRDYRRINMNKCM